MKNVGILVNLKIISKFKTPYMKGTRIFKEKKRFETPSNESLLWNRKPDK